MEIADVSEEQAAQAGYERLLAEKAERLEELLKRKPGQKGYKRRLRAFLEADAQTQRLLLDHIERSLGGPAEVMG